MDIVKYSPEMVALLAQGGSESLMPFTKEIYLQDIIVAGTGYCENIDDIFPKLQIDKVLKLQRDPKNKNDKLAIAVMFEDNRIGWVPRKQNEVLARLLDAGKNCFFRITTLSEEADKWKHIEGKIFMID